MTSGSIPVIDLFAGPGGLGEGFSAYRTSDGTPPFRVHLSVEMEKSAHTTLQLRAFFRQFRDRRVPDDYYEHLHGDLSLEELYEAWPDEAKAAAAEAWCAKLGQVDATEVHQRIEKALAGAKTWVLLGGPPCQAYSIAGRSRRSKDEDFEDDEKHTLYREYLRIIADHRPPVFVMENVKGLLSATLDGQSTFKRILEDLKHPCRALDVPTPDGDLEYRIYSLSKAVSSGDPSAAPDFQPSDYVVACEDYGVPQARHRIILLGIRSDLKVLPRTLKPRTRPVKVSKVISDLPRIRSGLSDCVDDFQTWYETLRAALEGGPLADNAIDEQVRELMVRLMGKMRKKLSTGREFIRCGKSPKYARKWYADARLKGVCNHVARRHIRQDLFRYFFVACYGRHQKTSPKLRHFPAALLPKHKNVDKAIKSSLFSDRFRVQLRNAPATTITSHIAKDGHYFIHPDPTQCRALTVREAARIQTFPDNYLFKGNRTQQYQQVGNAVPPFLARQIADIVRDVFSKVEIAAGDRSCKTGK